MINTKTIKELEKLVTDWNAIACNGVHKFTDKKKELQKSFVISEAQEVVEGYVNDDDVEILDGICDVFVTLSYLAFLYGKQTEAVEYFASIHKSLEDAIEQAGIQTKYRETALNSASSILFNLTASNFSKEAIVPVYAEFLMVLVCIEQQGIDVEGAIHEVMFSNYSKYPSVVIDLGQACSWIENNRAKTGVTVEKFGEYHVFKDAIGKVAKPQSFVGPNLQKFLQP